MLVEMIVQIAACPSYNDLSLPPLGSIFRYVREDEGAPPTVLGEEITGHTGRVVETVRLLGMDEASMEPFSRSVQAVGGLLVLGGGALDGESFQERRVSERDIERIEGISPGEEVQFYQELDGTPQEISIAFEGCRDLESESVSVYRLESPEGSRIVTISHKTGWWVRSTSDAGDLARIPE